MSVLLPMNSKILHTWVCCISWIHFSFEKGDFLTLMRPLLTNYNVCSNVRLYSGCLQFMLWCSKNGTIADLHQDLKTQVFLFRSCINGIFSWSRKQFHSKKNFKILLGLQFFFIEFLSTVRNGCYVNVNSVCNRQTIHPFIWLYVSFFNLYIFLEIWKQFIK